MSVVHVNKTINLVGSEGNYRGKDLGTLSFETKYDQASDKWEYIWILAGGPFGPDKGNYFWGTNRNANENKPNHVCLDLEGVRVNGVVFNFTSWKLKSPPDTPWFNDGDTICGALWILEVKNTKTSFNAAPKK